MFQVTDSKILQKLNRRLDEPRFAQVKAFLVEVSTSGGQGSTNRAIVNELLALPRVKENAQMRAILGEIDANIVELNFSGAASVAKRVLEAKVVMVNVPMADQSGIRQHRSLKHDMNEGAGQ